MKIGMREIARRATAVGVALGTVGALAACTGRGGGYLPPGPSTNAASFTGKASFGFAFSCEDPGGVNPQTGRLRIQLSYTDQGSGPVVKGPFTIHGTADQLDPVLESMICIGQNPPPQPKELVFLGRFRSLSTTPPDFPKSCAGSASTAAPCRFEVIVRDNDGNGAPSARDFFSISLSTDTAVSSKLDAGVFYARAGLLAGGNLTVD